MEDPVEQAAKILVRRRRTHPEEEESRGEHAEGGAMQSGSSRPLGDDDRRPHRILRTAPEEASADAAGAAKGVLDRSVP
jgi:hypothetical protein